MRTCGAEKLPWLVIEVVEVDAERAGCFAEPQLRLGLVGEEAIPETRDQLGRPAERTKARLRVRISAVHEGVDRGGTAQVLISPAMGTSAHPRACPCPPCPSPAAPIALSRFVPRCAVPALNPHPRQKSTRNLPAPSVFVPAIHPHPTSRVPARYPHPLRHPHPCVFLSPQHPPGGLSCLLHVLS